MQAVPETISVEGFQALLKAIEGVHSAKHMHIWQLDDEIIFMEAHVVLSSDNHKGIKRKHFLFWKTPSDYLILHYKQKVWGNQLSYPIQYY